MTKDNEYRFYIYRKKIIKDEENDFNEKESNILNESFLSKKELKKNLRDNETDEKDVFK